MIDHMTNIHRSDLIPMDHRELEVITMISNPEKYKRRYHLYRSFEKHMHDSGVRLWTIEVQQGERPFQITDANNPCHLQLRTKSIIWIKENALNIMMQRVTRMVPDYKYFAWIDADILFSNSMWAENTVSLLQKYKILQLWSSCHDLDYYGDTFATYRSFCWCYQQSVMNPDAIGIKTENGHAFNMGINDWKHYSTQSKPFWHSGYAWAMRRDTYEALGGPYDGGIFEVGILGSGDHHLALAFTHEAERSLPRAVSAPYFERLQEYQRRCERVVRKDIGYVPGSISHYFHGSKINRAYRTRWNILRDCGFDPRCDLTRDGNGLYVLVDNLTDRSIQLRDQIRAYFSGRDEDRW